jgi:hypothetical protein
MESELNSEGSMWEEQSSENSGDNTIGESPNSTSDTSYVSSIMDLTESWERENWESDYDEDIVDRIYIEDHVFLETEKEHGKYYIANVFCYDTYYILGTCISPYTFFRNYYCDIVQYMYEYSISIRYRREIGSPRNVNIIQLYIEDGVYKAVIKTFWLRIIQRHWKRQYSNRKKVINIRKSLHNLAHIQIRGRYVYGANYLPSLRGILSQYKIKS